MFLDNSYTLHSGGAIGSDFAWGFVGEMFGLKNIKHYYYGNPTPYGNVHISASECIEGSDHVFKANQTLHRDSVSKYMDLLCRNWVQVKNASTIYAIGFVSINGHVSGGTAWAVQMAIDEKKPVFVFNQYDSTWLLWDYSMKAFREYRKTPTLTRNFAGIGTRNLQTNGLQAIIDCYTETTTEKTLFD